MNFSFDLNFGLFMVSMTIDFTIPGVVVVAILFLIWLWSFVQATFF